MCVYHVFIRGYVDFYWEFPQEYFGKAVFEKRTIPCISLEGQKVFHSGYDPKEKDLHDMKILQQITKETM